MRHYEYILFDLDGTLTESDPGIINSVLYALKKNGIEETDREKLRAFVGPPLTESFQNYYGMSEEQAAHMVDDYREYYHDRGWRENSVYFGIPEALQILREQGRKLAVATSKPEMFAKQILSWFHLAPYFDLIAGATMDSSRSRKGQVISYALKQLGAGQDDRIGKERYSALADGKRTPAGHLTPLRGETNILMVGDRLHDVLGAKENGLPCVGVLYGYGTRRELEQAGVAAICREPKDLPDVIAELETKQTE